MKNILFITPTFAENSLGRTFSLWQLSERLGWSSSIASTRGHSIWKPLEGSEFARGCSLYPSESVEDQERLQEAAYSADLIIAVKPLQSSFGVAMQLQAATGTPVLVDIDDPDLDAVLARDRPLKRAAKEILKPAVMRQARQAWRQSQTVPRFVSNPVLQNTNGGVLIPHTRSVQPFGAPHTSREASIAFVGTNRQHKGVTVLREAVRELSHLGFTLTVTDVPPRDAYPWENWVGTTSLQRGLEIVAHSDVVVIPSLRSPWSNGQLPAKLIDAMMAGRAVAVSDIQPMPWAVGDTGMVFPAGDRGSLVACLSTLANPQLRQQMGMRARERALSMFTVEACLSSFERTCLGAIEGIDS